MKKSSIWPGLKVFNVVVYEADVKSSQDHRAFFFFFLNVVFQTVREEAFMSPTVHQLRTPAGKAAAIGGRPPGPERKQPRSYEAVTANAKDRGCL